MSDETIKRHNDKYMAKGARGASGKGLSMGTANATADLYKRAGPKADNARRQGESAMLAGHAEMKRRRKSTGKKSTKR